MAVCAPPLVVTWVTAAGAAARKLLAALAMMLSICMIQLLSESFGNSNNFTVAIGARSAYLNDLWFTPVLEFAEIPNW
jgi:hypothetical protein